MTKTICVCDCCGMEVDPGKLHDCYRELRTWKGYMCIPRTWEICENCLQHLQDAMEQEIKKLHGAEDGGQHCGEDE